MRYGLCTMAAMPLRKEPSHTSEMVNQLLFNEMYEVLDEKPGWYLVKTEEDRYEGWIQGIQHSALSEEEHSILRTKPQWVTTRPVVDYQGHQLSMGTLLYEPYGDTVRLPEAYSPTSMIDFAQKLLGTPYLWGGRTVFGIDCSGFVQLCARAAGKKLPRDASEQLREGELVYFLPEILPGDLAFFGNEDGHIVHVGMMLDTERILHASGRVRIDYLDQTGIFNKERNEHTHRLQVIKRLK